MFEMLIGKSSNVVNEVEFLGEVGVTGFINGLELASAVGLTAGTAQHSNEPWLHFRLDGVELYVAKKPYRHSVSWNQLDAVDAVFGTKTIEINGKTYKVRLLKSTVDDVYTGSTNSYDPVGAYGSEWNRLMYPINGGNPSSVSGEKIRFGTLAQYTDTDLVIRGDANYGSANWCQEAPSASSTSRVLRGSIGVTGLYLNPASRVHSILGWRPVLELVE